MKTITIRNIPDDVAGKLKDIAQNTNESVNTTVVHVLTNSLLPRKAKRVRNDFSRFCGGWSQEEFEQFELAVADCEHTNREEWK